MSPAVKVIAILALIAAAVLGYKAWEHHIYQQGYSAANAEWEAKEERIAAEAAEKLAAATADAQKRERELNLKLLRQTDQRIQENADHEKRMDALRARVRAGDERLRVAIDAHSIPQCSSSTDSAPGAGSGGETRAELMPATTERIFGIAAGITRLVRDYNAVVDAYNTARATCNAGG